MTENIKIPTWIEPKLFEGLLREKIPHFKEIKDFKAFSALPPGENYATVMLRIQIEVLLRDGTSMTESLMMKIPHDSKLYREEMSKFQLFYAESLMYSELVRELEQLYADVGIEVHFSPKSYKVPTGKEYILLEDLKQRGFRNAKRQEGLDMRHCHRVLKKLAQWHAASAVRVERVGHYEAKHVQGIANEVGIELIRSMMTTCAQNALKTAKTLSNYEVYYDQMEKMGEQFTDVLFQRAAVDPSDFNVLNHGDCWCNNIMFQYDDEGKLLETYFVDLQAPRYGNAAQDLLYFILTSSQLDLKFKRFDELIKYYYDHLIANLRLLKYSKPLPTLGDIHKMLIKAGSWAVFAAWNVLPIVLVESRNDAIAENIVGDSEDSQAFKALMYSNDLIRAHYDQFLPWLYHRGAFDLE